MIACAKWRINKHERTEEQLKGQLPQPGPDEEGRPAAQDFMKYLSSVRMKYMGTKPFACPPSYHPLDIAFMANEIQSYTS